MVMKVMIIIIIIIMVMMDDDAQTKERWVCNEKGTKICTVMILIMRMMMMTIMIMMMTMIMMTMMTQPGKECGWVCKEKG